MKRDSNEEQCDHPKSIFARRSSGLLGSRPLGAELESRPGGDKMAPLLGGGGGHWTLETWLSVPRRRRQGLARVAFLLSFLHNLGDHLEDEGAVAMGGRGRKEKKNSQCYASIGRPAERGMPPVLSVPSTPSSHIARGPVGLCGDDVGVTNGPLFSGPFFSHSCVKHSCWGTMKAASGRQPVPRAQRTEFTRRPLFPSPSLKSVCVSSIGSW